MKNCRGKLKKLKNWTNGQFLERLNRRISAPSRLARSVGSAKPLGKTAEEFSNKEEFFSEDIWREKSEEVNLLTAGDMDYADKVLMEFMDAEPEFVKYLRDDENWEIEGEDAAGMPVKAAYFGMKCCG
jgi:transcriptional regulator with XRE-family HTH domain